MIFTMAEKLAQFIDKESHDTIGILCYTNDQVEQFSKKLEVKYNIKCNIIGNGIEEHNIIGEINDFIENNNLDCSDDVLIREAFRFTFDICEENIIATLKKNDLFIVKRDKFYRMRHIFIKEILLLIKKKNELTNLGCFYKNIYEVIKSSNYMNIKSNYIEFLDFVFIATSKENNDINERFVQFRSSTKVSKLRKINVLTFHKSKGLEFDCVFLIGEKNCIRIKIYIILHVVELRKNYIL